MLTKEEIAELEEFTTEAQRAAELVEGGGKSGPTELERSKCLVAINTILLKDDLFAGMIVPSVDLYAEARGTGDRYVVSSICALWTMQLRTLREAAVNPQVLSQIVGAIRAAEAEGAVRAQGSGSGNEEVDGT